MKKIVFRSFAFFALILVVLFVVNYIPTWNLKTFNMREIKGQWINMYYENEEVAAKDTFNFADSNSAIIAQKLGFTNKENVNVYVYDSQHTMMAKKYGYIVPVLSSILDVSWYIGDNIGTNVILTSPANPGPVHTYEDNKEAVLHEITHAYISKINPKISLWLTEGVALYLTNGRPFYKKNINNINIPSYEDIFTRNPIKFNNIGGYDYAHTYIEYLDKNYGWEKVLELLKTEDYEQCFNKTSDKIYQEWVDFIYNYHQ